VPVVCRFHVDVVVSGPLAYDHLPVGRHDDSGTVRVSADDRAQAKRRLDEVRAHDKTAAGDFAPTVSEKDLAAGQAIGEYVIEELIGRGGFGAVYRAIQPLIGKRVAVKVLSRKYSADQEIVSRFIAEARAVNQIRHKNIIDIFSFGQLADGRHYYVMELLDGAPLDKYLAEHGPLALEIALPILKQVARALDAAHAKGIAHRDLKPENIVLLHDEDGGLFPKLLDFGIAKLTDPDEERTHHTGTGVPLGTPYYMSPEQCRGKDVDHRTDIYSFGVLAFRLLTAEYPFDGEMIDVLHKHVHDDPPRASTKLAGLPARVDDAIDAMLRKNPDQRPRTATAAVEALYGGELTPRSLTPRTLNQKRVATNLATADTHVSGLGTKPQRSRFVWLGIGGLAAIGVAIGLIVWQGREEPTRSSPPVAVTPAPPPPPPVTKPAPPPQPSDVLVTIGGPPEGTEVKRAGATIGTAPGKVQLPRGDAEVVLTLVADGYLPKSVTVKPDRDQDISVTLKKKPRAGVAPQPPNKDDIIHTVPGLQD